MKVKTGLILFGTLALCTSSFAGTIDLITSAADLDSNDSVDWSQLGTVDATSVIAPLTTTSANGDTVTVSLSIADPGATLFVNGGGTVSAGSPFGSGDTLLSFFDLNTDNGTGPATFSTSSGIYGMGAALAPDSAGAFTAEIQIYGASGLLDTVSESSDSGGDPIFIGFLDTDPEVTSAVFSLTDGTNNNGESNYLGDFTVDTLLLNDQASTTPEPASMLLVGGGLMAFGLLRRRSRKQS